MPQPYLYAGNIANSVANGQANAMAYNSTDSYYILPYSDTQKLLIQYGIRNSTTGGIQTNVTFRVAYTSGFLPAIFATPFDTFTYGYQTQIYNYANTGFTCNVNPNNPNCPAFVWWSIGLFTG